jgi:transglutaminase-like putative cysteine protease
MNIESYRATRAEALAETQPAEFNLGLDVAVPVDRPIESPHRTKRIRYRVKLEGGDPAGVFESGPSQQVKSIDPHTAELTVFAVRPEGPLPNPEAPDDPPTDDDRTPNSLIQSDDPAIVAKAQEAGGDPADPWQVATALERCAGDVITSGGYSQAFATAAEVIETGRGDCTEHAVLLAALARARKIPARVAMGLVYQDRAFYYHMWTEVHVAGRWVGLDATLGQGAIGAAHLKMAHTNLKGASALSSLLPVLQVIGRLEIEILEVE